MADRRRGCWGEPKSPGARNGTYRIEETTLSRTSRLRGTISVEDYAVAVVVEIEASRLIHASSEQSAVKRRPERKAPVVKP